MPDHEIYDYQDDDERMSTAQQIHSEVLGVHFEERPDSYGDEDVLGYDGDRRERGGRLRAVNAFPYDDTLGQAPDASAPPQAPAPTPSQAPGAAQAQDSAPPQVQVSQVSPPSPPQGPPSQAKRPLWRHPLMIGLGVIGAASLGWWMLAGSDDDRKRGEDAAKAGLKGRPKQDEDFDAEVE